MRIETLHICLNVLANITIRMGEEGAAQAAQNVSDAIADLKSELSALENSPAPQE